MMGDYTYVLYVHAWWLLYTVSTTSFLCYNSIWGCCYGAAAVLALQSPFDPPL